MDDPLRGIALARALYRQVVQPAVRAPHAASLIGEGSEVLGYDTDRSTDHAWGPRLQVFVAGADVEQTAHAVEVALPQEFAGRPTRWFSPEHGGVAHHVEIDTFERWMTRRLPTLPAEPDRATWLAAPQQHLLQLTAGEVFRDDLGELTRRRRAYHWCPADLWRWMLAGQWHLIGNTEPLLGRTIETGDARGARLLAARLVRLIMEMAYLQQRRFRPYPKWFGRGFQELPGLGALGSAVDAALAAPPSLQPDGPLPQALLHLAATHNALGLCARVEPMIQPFAVGIDEAVRPYPVLNSGAFVDALVASIEDDSVRNLPRVGAIDQLTHGDDQLINFTTWPAALAEAYRAQLTP